MKSNTYSFAERELDILSKSATDPDNRPIIEPFRNEILALCDAFGKSGQSGGSAPYTASAIAQAVKKLMLQNPIMPMTGIDDEWMDVGHMGSKDEKECVYQNRRCYNLFKNSEGRVWFLDAIVWKGDTPGESGNNWDTFTGMVEGITSRQYVKAFPFTPKTFYIDVTREILPADWTEEPFYENKYYNTKEFEETGQKNWFTEKHRYIIKNHNQLKRVWKYYNRYA